MAVGLRLLGEFQAVGSGGKPLSVTSSKGRLVLAYLALLGDKGCARDQLARLVWEDRRPEQAQLSLRQELARLRAALNVHDVRKWNDKQLLRLPSEVSTDVSSFLAAVAVGLVMPITPLAADLGFVPLPPAFFLFLMVATATYLMLVEWVKRRFMRAKEDVAPTQARARPSA